MLNNILYKEEELTHEEIIYLLNLHKTEDLKKLFQRADEIRKLHCGNEVHLRGVIEFSNFCIENCKYCGLRRENIALKRYRMGADEIIETAKNVINQGIKTIVLQSGEDSFYDTDVIAHIIYSIKQITDVAVTLCLGERDFKEYNAWKIAGADRYLLKHETSNPDHFIYHHSKNGLEKRISHLKYLKNIGFQVGSGTIVGLPMQETADLANDILLCKELNVDMAAIGTFVPSPLTLYHNFNHGNVELTIKTIAAARIVLKNVHIPATTTLDTIDKYGREKGLNSGANVVMPNFTPFPYRGDYQIYANKRGIKDDPFHSYKLLQSRIESTGRIVSSSRGDSLRINKTA